jgi:hypothetical protein
VSSWFLGRSRFGETHAWVLRGSSGTHIGKTQVWVSSDPLGSRLTHPWVQRDPSMGLAIRPFWGFSCRFFCCFVRYYLVHSNLFFNCDNLNWHLFIGQQNIHILPQPYRRRTPARVVWFLLNLVGGHYHRSQ